MEEKRNSSTGADTNLIENRIKVLVFDFDGVIVDSNKLKYDAFFELFPTEDKSQKIIKETLLKYREKSRFFIIEEIIQRLKNNKTSQISTFKTNIDYYAEKYRSIVEKGAVECDEIPGAKESLKILSLHFPLYINSTTPLQSLKIILRERKLLHFFKDVYGSPHSKIQNLASILEKESVSGKETLIIGDGHSDREAALHFGCVFIGIKNQFNDFGETNEFIKLENLKEFSDSILPDSSHST